MHFSYLNLNIRCYSALSRFQITFPMKKLLHFREPQDNVSIAVLIFFARCAALTAYNALNGPVPVKAGDYVLVLGSWNWWCLHVSPFFLPFSFLLYYTAPLFNLPSLRELLLLQHPLLMKNSKLLPSSAKYMINYKTTPKWDEEIQKIVCCASSPYSHTFKWQHLNYNTI